MVLRELAQSARRANGASRGRDRTRGRRLPAPRTLCAPLHSTDELLSWRPTASAARCISRVPLPDSAIARYTLPFTPSSRSSGAATTNHKRPQPARLLLCHDFAGGYPVAEAASEGVSGADCPSDSKLWKFNHWAYVDVFVYFSHERVTIPPVGYIHAAHRHGSLALGTLIFEWEAGAVDLKKMLASYTVRAKAATQLAKIAKFFGFDGWLVNVECALTSGASGASDLAAFVADLTRACRKALGPASEVVWYDSVTRKGELKWQNELNEENDVFFKAAGAMFTNYHWSRNAPVRSAMKAGPRRCTDIFTGIDVHGRNTFGGGGFQTHVALHAIKIAGTSAAIFAPAWTVESCPSNVDPLELEERFWTGPRGRFGRECVAKYYKERAVLTQLPFVTFFDPGWGPRTVSAGKVVSEERYFNMSKQDVQPSFLRAKPASGDCATTSLALSHEHALNGSAAVRLTFSFSESRMLSGTYAVLRLFIANVSFPKQQYHNMPHAAAAFSSSECLRISYQYYVDDNSAALRPSASQHRMRATLGERYNENDQVYYDSNSMKSDPFDDEAGAGPGGKSGRQSAAAARATGADQFGLLLLFAAPPRAVLLVGENSRWASGSEPGVQRSAKRLQILEKFVDYIAFTPVIEEPVRGAPTRSDGAPSWMSRTFELPASMTSGQRLAEVMVLLGEPPLQPISVRPSPLMTPATRSRTMSQRGSRLPSRSASPRRQISDTNSRISLRSQRQPLTRIGAELLSAGILGEEDPSTPGAKHRESFRNLYDAAVGTPNGAGGRFATTTASGLTGESSDNGSDFGGSDASDRDSFKSFNSRKTSLLESRTKRYPRQTSMPVSGAGVGTRANRMDEIDYASNFQVRGSVDFSQMEDDLLSTSTSRAISRLGSRLGTPDGGRSRLSARRSHMASRQSSMTNSLAGSRLGSRNVSRAMSPSTTPLGGGGGSQPLRSYSARGSMTLSRSNTMRTSISDERRAGGGGTDSVRASAALADLKSALMNAAGSMASGGHAADAVAGPAGRGRGPGGRTMQRVFLGGLALEVVDVSQRG